MEGDINKFYDEVILPKIYLEMDKILPEFNFKWQGKWVSGNKLRVTGREGSKTESVIIYPDSPFQIVDFADGNISLVKYLQESTKHTPNSYIEVIKYLAKAVGVEVPERELTPEAKEAYQKRERRSSLLEETNNYLNKCLHSNKDLPEVSGYLSSKGYVDRFSKMGLGYLPSKKGLYDHLKELDFTYEESERALSLHSLAGDTHKLSIPWRDPYGRLIGVVWRNINHKPGEPNKYLMPMGFDRGKYLFNQKALKEDKDLVIVEGILDPLHCESLGLSNIVAIVGAKITKDQVNEAIRFGAKKITLCFDMDSSGQSGNDKAIDQLLEINPNLKIYVATLPEGFKDPDELVKAQGVEAFKSCINWAKRYYEYKIDNLLPLGGFTHKEEDRALTTLGEFLPKVREEDKDSYISKVKDRFGALGIPMEKLYQKAKDSRLSQDLIKLSKEANRLAEEGRNNEAISLLSNIGKHLNAGISFTDLLEPITEAWIREKLKLSKDAIKSGYFLEINREREPLYLPNGALSIVAGATSHGKTTVLLNLGLNVVKDNPDLKVHFFSYEEGKEAIVLKALNTYIGMELSNSNRKSITSYFKTGDMSYFTNDSEIRSQFIELKDKFFKEFIYTGRLRIHYVDYSSTDLIGAIRYFKDKGECDLVLIDYMQLLRLSEVGKLSRQEELKQICLDLKNLAVDTGLPLLLGAQFNREVQAKENMAPYRIGEAGDIERIANLILGIWNNRDEGTMYLEVLKGRDIGSGYSTLLNFNGNQGRINQSN